MKNVGARASLFRYPSGIPHPDRPVPASSVERSLDQLQTMKLFGHHRRQQCGDTTSPAIGTGHKQPCPVIASIPVQAWQTNNSGRWGVRGER